MIPFWEIRSSMTTHSSVNFPATEHPFKNPVILERKLMRYPFLFISFKAVLLYTFIQSCSDMASKLPKGYFRRKHYAAGIFFSESATWPFLKPFDFDRQLVILTLSHQPTMLSGFVHKKTSASPAPFNRLTSVVRQTDHNL